MVEISNSNMKLLSLSFLVILMAFVIVKVFGEESDDERLNEIKFRSGRVRQLWDKAKKVTNSQSIV